MKTHVLSGIRSGLRKIGIEIARAPKDPYQLDLYRQLYTSEELAKKPFYNIGAGGFSHPLWTNLDYISDWYKGRQKGVIHHDLMSKEPLPIGDGEAKIVYTSHTIEHVKEDAVEVLFQEAYRCLDMGGVFRVTTGPDAETDHRALMLRDANWFYWDEAYVKPGSYEHNYHAPATSVPLAERWLRHVATPLAKNDLSPSPKKFEETEILAILNEKGLEASLDFFCSMVEFDPQRPSNHISWWTHGKIMDLMKKVGFRNVYRSGYRQSAAAVMRKSHLFDSTHPQMSIYVEAIKD